MENLNIGLSIIHRETIKTYKSAADYINKEMDKSRREEIEKAGLSDNPDVQYLLSEMESAYKNKFKGKDYEND